MFALLRCNILVRSVDSIHVCYDGEHTLCFKISYFDIKAVLNHTLLYSMYTVSALLRCNILYNIGGIAYVIQKGVLL